jgi:hypothetical protein
LVAFDGADITKVPDPEYILGSGRLALTGASADLLANDLLQRVYMGLDGATAIDDDADAARESDGAAVEEKEPR